MTPQEMEPSVAALAVYLRTAAQAWLLVNVDRAKVSRVDAAIIAASAFEANAQWVTAAAAKLAERDRCSS